MIRGISAACRRPEGLIPAAHPNGGRVLIPGCGSGYEVAAFAAAGYDVVAIDSAEAAVERARATVGPALEARILRGDFFTHDFGPQPFDVIYERTFICWFDPDQRPAYRDRVAALLRHHGSLVGYFFDSRPGGGAAVWFCVEHGG